MRDEIHVKRNGNGARRILRAARCSFSGFQLAWQFEAAFRQECILSLVLIVCSFALATSLEHWCFLIGSLIFLLFAEVVNSAIETLADRITLEEDESIKRAKDLGSAAVFLALVLIVVVWGHAFFSWLWLAVG
jgi:diacylglycerol kinase (ATP)